MPARAIIVGDRTDAHVVAVLAELAERDAPAPLVFDADSLTRTGFALTDDSLEVDGTTVTLGSNCRGWLRRYAPSMWGAGLVSGSLEAVRRRAFLTLAAAITRRRGIEWLTTLDAILAAEDRLAQLDVVRATGYRTPKSVVTSSAAHACAILGDRFLVKPLGQGFYHAVDGPKAVFSTVLTRDNIDAVDFAHAPFVAQSIVDAQEHLRVVTVGNRTCVAKLDATRWPVDWRQAEEAHASWQAAEDTEACDAARRVATAFRVGYTSQDWIRDRNGNLWFLDLNPAGQWLFLPNPIAGEVTASVADHLHGDNQ